MRVNQRSREPSWLFDAPELPPRSLTNCQRLCLAVLGDALTTLHTTRGVVFDVHHPATFRRWGLRAETLAWFHAETDTPFSFVAICQATGLDPDHIRAKLARDGWVGIPRLHRATWQHRRYHRGDSA